MAQSVLIGSSQTAFDVVLLLILIQAIFVSSEHLAINNIFNENGLLSWKIKRLNYAKYVWFVKSKSLIKLLENYRFTVVLISRIMLACITLIMMSIGFSITIPLVLLSVITLFITLRTGYSNNGADQMASIIILSLVLGRVFLTNLSIPITLIFIAAQASLAYATSGFLKFTKAGWRNGSYIIGILKTSTFGNKKILQFLQNRRSLSVIVSNMVVYGDIVLSFALFFPPHLCLLVLAFGVLLHIGIAFVMGLNTFIWSFCATYPAIYFVSNSLYHLI